MCKVNVTQIIKKIGGLMQIRPLCEYYTRGNTPLEGGRKVLEGMLYFYPYLTRLIAYLAMLGY